MQAMHVSLFALHVVVLHQTASRCEKQVLRVCVWALDEAVLL